MGEICLDDRFEIIERAKDLLEKTNIHTLSDEMAVLDSLRFLYQQMDWLKKYDEVDCDKCLSENCRMCIHNPNLADCYREVE